MKGKGMKNYDENYELRFRPRPSETVPVRIPRDTLTSLEKLAQSRDMSCEALIRFYIGQGLREDMSKRFADHVLETTARILSHHIKPEEKLSEIMEEIQNESAIA